MKEKEESINHFRFKEFEDNVLVTTEHGSWTSLSKEEFEQLKSKKINDELKPKLEEKGILLTERSTNTTKRDFYNRFKFLKQGASLHIVVVTKRCNHKCLYCHAAAENLSKSDYDMDEETAKKTVDFIFQSPSNSITIEFQGGEPLLNFDVIKTITKYAKEKNLTYKKKLQFVMVSNLTVMDDDILDYCIKNDIFLCTSLDGPEGLHDKNRKFPGSSHSLVSKWIKKIQGEYKERKIDYTKINALITVSKDTLSMSKEIIDEYLSHDLDGVHLRFINQLGFAEKNVSHIGYTPEEFIAFWKKALDYIIDKNKKGTFFTERGAVIILKKLLEKEDPNYLDMRSPCGAVIGQLAYNYDGNIYCCDEGRSIESPIFRVGNVHNDTYAKTVRSENSCAIISASINDTTICDLCTYKPFCGLCPVCAYAEQGTITGIVPQTTQCKVYMAQFDYIIDKLLTDKEAKKIFELWIKHY